MKLISTLTLFTFLLTGFSLAKEYILDKENYMQPAGTVLEKQMIMTMRDSKLTLKSNGNDMHGVMNSVMSEAVETKIISPNKFRSLMKINLKTGTTVVEGKEMPEDNEEEPLLNVPLIFEKKDGKWTATPEKGKLNKVQIEELEELVEDENKVATMYGYNAKKVGDVWEVDLPALVILLGADELTKGKATVSFKGVKKFNGMECAELVVVFDVEGKQDDVDLKMKGTAYVTRSLEFLADIKVAGEMNVELEGEVQPGLKMEIKTKAVINEEITIKAPAPVVK